MGKEYLVEGAKLVCIHGSDFSLLEVPEGHGYTSGGNRRLIVKIAKSVIIFFHLEHVERMKKRINVKAIWNWLKSGIM